MHFTDEQFDQLVAEVWQKLATLIPPDLQRHLEGVQFRIENDLPPEVLDDLRGTDLENHAQELCGLHLGWPLTEASLIAPNLYPTRVYLFRRALLDLVEFDGSAEAVEDLREEIAITLLHEIGHFFGLEEDDLERLGFD